LQSSNNDGMITACFRWYDGRITQFEESPQDDHNIMYVHAHT